MGIAVRHLRKNYGSFRAVDDVSFDVEAGSLVALLGPSGSGKSTILRIIAGLEVPDTGEIHLTGENATHLPVQRRGIGFVFQHYSLFKHMTARQNVAFGLEVRKLPKQEIKERVAGLLDLVGLSGYAERYPSQLSGGQRQRVALARALAPQPQVLLLDEPFGALDARVRAELRGWLRRLHDEMHVTSLFVTHDQDEAFEISDSIVIVNGGKIEQTGSPQEICDSPATPFVSSFIRPAASQHKVTRAPGAGKSNWDGVIPGGSSELTVADYAIASGSPTEEGTVAGMLGRCVIVDGSMRLDVTLQDGSSLHLQIPRDQFRELGVIPGDTIFVNRIEKKLYSGVPAI